VDAHEREVVNETEGRDRRGSVHQRTDSAGSHGTDPTPPDDDVSLDEDDLERMGGDEVSFCFGDAWTTC
jgi:hypothetical protein